jgi:GrpE protein
MTGPGLPSIAVLQSVAAAAGGLAAGIAATFAVMRRARPDSHADAPAAPFEPAAFVPEPASETAEVRGALPPVAQRLIEIRDHLVAGTLSPELATVIYARLGRALEDVGVRTLDATGPVDWALQEPVGTEPTAEHALDQTVASSVRPGYRFGDAVVRPQQVIVYVARAAED